MTKERRRLRLSTTGACHLEQPNSGLGGQSMYSDTDIKDADCGYSYSKHPEFRGRLPTVYRLMGTRASNAYSGSLVLSENQKPDEPLSWRFIRLCHFCPFTYQPSADASSCKVHTALNSLVFPTCDRGKKPHKGSSPISEKQHLRQSPSLQY